MVGRSPERPREVKAVEEHEECSVRCLCGSLLARLVPGGVELKCRRCKQTRVIPLSHDSGSEEQS